MEKLMQSNGKNHVSNGNDMMHAFKDAPPSFPGHMHEMEDADISPEERRKMIAEWLINWLKEGDARLAVH